MPILFKHFLSFPSAYNDRNSSILPLKQITFITNVQILDNILKINGRVGNHAQTIELTKSKTLLNSEIKLFCDCESFRYEFYYTLLKHGAIPKEYTTIFENLNKSIIPKKKNVHGIISGCKHCISLCNEIQKQEHKNNLIKEFFKSESK